MDNHQDQDLRTASAGYAHSNSSNEIERQNVLLNRGTFNSRIIHFYQTALKDLSSLVGKTIVDLGCGNGDLTCLLAECVGPAGKVIAIDINKEQIKNLSQLAADKNYTQIVPVAGDALKLCSIIRAMGINHIDGIHIRFLLTHFTAEERKTIYSAIQEILTPNGFIAIGEGILSYAMNNCSFINLWVSACTLAATILNVNYNYGLKLITELESFGFVPKASQEIAGDPLETIDAKLGICTDLSDMLAIIKENFDTLPKDLKEKAQEILTICSLPDFEQSKQTFMTSKQPELRLTGMFVLAT